MKNLTKLIRAPILLTGLVFFNASCEKLFPPEEPGPDAKRVAKVERCNKYGTCLVIFEDGSHGLMTKPETGIYACRAFSERSYNKCEGPKTKDAL